MRVEGPITAERDAAAVRHLAFPPEDRQPMVLHLPPEPESPALARNLLGDACCRWDRTHLLHAGRLIMSELVTNAVEHVGSEFTVVVARHGPGLRLAVADAEPRLPHVIALSPPRPGRPLDERGCGLRTVQSTAADWGAAATPAGKVVWATIR
jgi:hypothetical protein